MTRPIYEPSPTRTDAVLGYGSDQLFRRPAPVSSPIISTLMASSSTNLGSGSPTTIVYSATGGFTDGSYFQINGSGKLEILTQGVYGIQLSSRNWSFNVNVTSNWEVRSDVTSGSNGEWTNDDAGVVFASSLGRINPAAGGLDVSLIPVPDINAYATWDSGSVFPAVITVTYDFFEDEVRTANTTPFFFLYVVRFGNCAQ